MYKTGIKMSELRQLMTATSIAEDRYLELRDAKSNGCCVGMSIREVLAYDDNIMAAWADLQNCRNAESRYHLTHIKEGDAE